MRIHPPIGVHPSFPTGRINIGHSPHVGLWPKMRRWTMPWPIGVSHGVTVHLSPTGVHSSVPTGRTNIGHPLHVGLPSKMCRGTTPWPIGVSHGIWSIPNVKESGELLPRRSLKGVPTGGSLTLVATPHDAPASDTSHMWVFRS